MREQSTQRLLCDDFFGYFLVRAQESNAQPQKIFLLSLKQESRNMPPHPTSLTLGLLPPRGKVSRERQDPPLQYRCKKNSNPAHYFPKNRHCSLYIVDFLHFYLQHLVFRQISCKICGIMQLGRRDLDAPALRLRHPPRPIVRRPIRQQPAPPATARSFSGSSAGPPLPLHRR